MTEHIENSCAFCGNPITSADKGVMAISKYKISQMNDLVATLSIIVDEPTKVSHEDCWEGRNGFTLARRRKIAIGGI